VTGTGAMALVLWTRGKVEVGTVAMALPLAWQIVNIAGFVALQITTIFENVGVIQEGMMTIARPIALTDPPNAAALKVTRGEIRFEDVYFGYGRASGVIERLTLTVEPGEKIGLIGRSGAGKSTLVNLLLRFFDLEGGCILIDGQDIASVTQESLRAQICVVTQDTSLLHRSIRDNIRYGRPRASDAEVIRAAKLAHADEFIHELEDWKKRRGYESQVGERGVKLSGGQRQRISIARAILAEPRILILDEATSSLDSESEQMIQQGLSYLMQGRTTFVIAHRLSTIRRADQIMVMEQGQIVERGTHAQLYAARGRYYDLYTRQHGVEENLFLAPGEGDAVAANGNGAGVKNGDAKPADAMRVLRGEVR
jgi:ATP-binding cassette, subfamily B, multidrug efflux pump